MRGLKNWFIYRAMVASIAVARHTSLPRARAVGRAIGRLTWLLGGGERRRAMRNLTMAFPERSKEELERIGLGMCYHIGESLFELFSLESMNREDIERVTELEGAEHLRRAVEIGRGVVLFTGHIGNWEWLPVATWLAGVEITTIAREIYDPRINAFIVGVRTRFGVKSIGRGSDASAREIMKTLRAGGILGFLIDQSIRAENVMVPFFGKDAPTPVGPARLAIRSEATVITAWIERRQGKLVGHFEPPMETRRTDDPVALTATMTTLMERQIARVPEQWVWVHDRWKERRPSADESDQGTQETRLRTSVARHR